VSRNRWSESRGAAVGLGSGVGETAKAQEEWFAGVLVVLMRAGVKALGFCNELSTAATMWGRRWLGKSWRARRRAARKGNRAGVGKG
jgi:hypothetical protein